MLKTILEENEHSTLELVRLLSINLLYYIDTNNLIDLKTLFYGFYIETLNLYEKSWQDRIEKAIKHPKNRTIFLTNKIGKKDQNYIKKQFEKKTQLNYDNLIELITSKEYLITDFTKRSKEIINIEDPEIITDEIEHKETEEKIINNTIEENTKLKTLQLLEINIFTINIPGKIQTKKIKKDPYEKLLYFLNLDQKQTKILMENKTELLYILKKICK